MAEHESGVGRGTGWATTPITMFSTILCVRNTCGNFRVFAPKTNVKEIVEGLNPRLGSTNCRTPLQNESPVQNSSRLPKRNKHGCQKKHGRPNRKHRCSPCRPIHGCREIHGLPNGTIHGHFKATKFSDVCLSLASPSSPSHRNSPLRAFLL